MIKFYIIFSIAWFILLLIAFFNAKIREKFYKKKFGDLRSHQLSSIIFILIVFASCYFLLKIPSLEYLTTDLFIMGGLWAFMTIAFEFLFGHYVMKHSWKTLFKDYNIFKGRLWLLVVLSELFGPILMHTAL